MSRLSLPGVRGWISPRSSAMVTVPMVPWPHIGRQPEVSMNRIATSQSSRVGGIRIEPDIMSWPRGSNIRLLRIQSNSARKWARRSIMVRPRSAGAPPATMRTGLPQVCPSMQKNVCVAIVSRGLLESILEPVRGIFVKLHAKPPDWLLGNG